MPAGVQVNYQMPDYCSVSLSASFITPEDTGALDKVKKSKSFLRNWRDLNVTLRQQN